MYPRALQDLIKALSRLPGIGPKTAERLALNMVHLPKSQVLQLSQTIGSLQESVHVCASCGTLSETPLCRICQDTSRDQGLVAVVESPADMEAMEASLEYEGVYHVLAGSLNPMEGIGPKQLRVEALKQRLDTGVIKEVLIATNPTVEGEATANLVFKSLADYPVKISRLAYGMPVGGNLQYLDGLTLSHALSGRISLKEKE